MCDSSFLCLMLNVEFLISRQGIIPIKGITSVDKVALVTLEGASAIGGSSGT